MITSWATFQPPESVITAFLISTDQFAALEDANWLGWLKDQDTARLEGASTKRRREFLLSRFLLRYAVATRYAVDPGKLLVTERSGATPAIDIATRHGVSFSLSHSKKWILVAVADDLPSGIGVDIEFCRPDRDFANSITAFCSADEQAIFADIASESARMEWFYKTWTRKEAAFKLNSANPESDPAYDTIISGRYGDYSISAAAKQPFSLSLTVARLCPAEQALRLSPTALQPA